MYVLSLLLNAAALSPDAAEALASGDCASAVSLLPAPTVATERLAIGRCLIRLERPREALDLLEPALQGVVADYAALLAGEAGLLLGRPAEAAEVLALVSLSGESGERAAMLRGRALIESGQYLAGRDVLRALLTGSLAEPGTIPSPLGADPAEVRWWLAEGARLRGDPDLAVPVWRTLWTHNPSSPFADRAAERMAAYDRAPPDPTTDEGQQLIRTRITTMKSMNLYREALALSLLLPVDDSQAGVKKRAHAAFQGRDYAAAVDLYAQIAAPSATQRFNHALSCSRIGDYDAAAQIYTALFETYPDHSKADFASYKLGYLAYDSNNLEEGIVLFRQHLRRYPSSAHADEARWFIGWSLIRLEKLEAADVALRELRSSNPKSSLAPGARYWQARIAGMGGDAETEAAGLRAVLSSWPTSGYSWLAAERLGQTWPTQEIVAPPSPPEALAGTDWTLGVSLADVGLDGWARERLRSLKGSATSKEAKLALAHALIGAGDYVTAQRLARPYCTASWKGGDPIAMQACYPRPQGELVRRVASAASLDENLPYAIMTAESALKPWVSSPAGARGLMQLMPELGAELHELRGYATPYHPDDLYQPGYNAALGVTELGRLYGEFGGLPMSIAGYNGGAEAVRRWLGNYPTPPDLDRFSEDVGYTETRRYVRRVLGYLQAYRYIYGD